MPDDYDYQERAAILEFEAGLSRSDAEAEAQYQINAAQRSHPPAGPDPGTQHPSWKPFAKAAIPYSHAAARESPEYHRSRQQLGEILKSTKLKGATP